MGRGAGKQGTNGTLLCCWAEEINPLACAGGSWAGEARMPVVSPELQEQEKSLLTRFVCYSILLLTQGVVPPGSTSLMVPTVTEVCRGPYRGTADGREGGEGKRGHRKGEGCHNEDFVKLLKVSLWLCWM